MTDAVPTSPLQAANRFRFDRLWMLACWVPYALLTCKFWFVCDDAFISFRYARNWATGHGLRFNLGDHVPVEGYSNFLWVCVATLFERVRLEPQVWMPVVSFAAGSLLIIAVFLTLRRSFGMSLATVVPACLFLGCAPSVAVWSTSGLETVLFSLLVFLTFQRVVLRSSGPAGVTGGLAAMALSLIRAEGFAWAVLIGLLGLGSQFLRPRRSIRPFVAFFAVLLVGYGAYFAARYGYYRLPLPNTAYVKVDPSESSLLRGWHYSALFYITFISPFVALFGVVPALWADRRNREASVAVMAVAFPVYSMVVGGDFMTMGRLLVPGLAFHAILFARLLETCAGSRAGRRALVSGSALAVILIGVLPAWDVHPIPESFRSRFHFRLNSETFRSERAQWEFMKDNAQNWEDLGTVLGEISAPGDSIVFNAIGAVAYFSNLFVFDQYGLISPEVTAVRSDPDRLHSPGHDLFVPPEFFVPQRPTYLNLMLIAPGPNTGPLIQAWVDQAVQKVDPNLYAPQFVNIASITKNQGAPLLIVLRLPPEGVTAREMWSRYRADLKLWSI